MSRMMAMLLGVALTAWAAEFAVQVGGADPLVFSPGEAKVSVQVFASAAWDADVRLEVQLGGVQANAYDQRRRADLQAGGPFLAVPFSFDLPEPGLYELTATVVVQERPVTAASTYLLATPYMTETIPDLGVQTHLGKWGAAERLLKYVRHVGLARIRDEVYWATIEREPGKFAWPARCDAMLDTAAALGLKPLLILDYGNPVAYPTLFPKNRSFPESDEARARFVAYVENQVRRYGKIVKDWELWNEPNNVKPAVYLKLLQEVAAKIRALDPSATVISCGGGGAGGGPSAAYITPIVRNGGVDAQDAFSVHPYMAPADPDVGYGPCKGSPLRFVNVASAWAFLNRFCAANPRSDGSRLRFWVTEIGWPTGEGRNACGELEQAAFIARLLIQHRRANCAEALFIYDLLSDGYRRSNAEHNFGLLRPDFSPKPSFAALAAFNRLIGSKKCTEVVNDDANVKVFRFSDTLVAYACGRRTPYDLDGIGKAEIYQWDGFKTPQQPVDGRLTLRLNILPTYVRILEEEKKE